MAELRIYDFTKRNKWINFKKRMTTPAEKEIVEYLELMEKQINLLTAYLHNLEFQQAKVALFEDNNKEENNENRQDI